MAVNEHAQRISALREVMRENGAGAVLMTVADYHGSEYNADFFKSLQYYSGFSGENSTLIVMENEADIWVDGRYFIQAEREIEGSGITLQKMGESGVPTVEEFLASQVPSGITFCFDGRSIMREKGLTMERILSARGVSIRADLDLAGLAWTDRPALPSHPVFLLDEKKYAGEVVGDKLTRLRRVMKEHGCRYYASSKLDEIMWLFNIRGGDVECNPVALSYTFVTEDGAYLFIQKSEVSDELRAYADEKGITLREYADFARFVREYPYKGSVLLDPSFTSYTVYEAVRAGLAEAADNASAAESAAAESKAKPAAAHKADTQAVQGSSAPLQIVEANSPVDYMKAVKNATELRNFREVYIEDSAQLTRFIIWVKKNAGKIPMTEGSAAKYLDGLRAQIKDFVGLSFPTISAYGPNAAMMHYEPGYAGDPVKPEGMLLVDSGGHYMRGTTDVTRTMALGPVTEDMRRSYTLTVNSNLSLLACKFLAGCDGMALDIIAREPMWEVGMDYKCGTGHGIGYLLNVHEGPQTIRYRKRDAADHTPFAPGMVVSDEPGVYKAGQYGIRIETILECVEEETTADGTFLGFRPLTFVPLDRDLIDPQYLTQKTKKLLNDYHRETYDKLSPLLNEDENKWLKEQCAPF